MKAFGLVVALVAFLGTGFMLQEKADKPEKGTTTKVTTTYACPMHADVKSDVPGSCSKCNMALVKVSEKVEKTVVKKDMKGCCGKCCAKSCDMKEMSQKACADSARAEKMGCTTQE